MKRIELSPKGLYKVTINNVVGSEIAGNNRPVYYIHSGEKIVLKIQTLIQLPQGENYQVYYINNTPYYSDADGLLYVDMTDAIRSAIGSRLAVEIVAYREQELIQEDTINFYYQIYEGINVYDAYMFDAVQMLTGLTPPNVIYTHPQFDRYYNYQFVVGRGFSFDIFFKNDYQDSERITATPYAEVGVLTLPQKNLHDNLDSVIKIENVLTKEQYNLQELDSICTRCAMVRWRSAVGAYKQAVWKIKKLTFNADSLELQPIADGYKAERGKDSEFVIYIEGLNRYDYAYYSDIATSGDIHIVTLMDTYDSDSAADEDADLTGEETRVTTSADTITLPDADAGELRTLEITIKYKHYDTI